MRQTQRENWELSDEEILLFALLERRVWEEEGSQKTVIDDKAVTSGTSPMNSLG